ncbi:MAG: Ig-like domain-containing protein, partial [Methanosarcinales archaeon]|nr:Ig-like domain-containing protein [Methanosarcinales archaeon]
SLQAPAAPPENYIPPDPTNLANTTSNYWVNYTWSVGTGGNVTDGYNVSLNSAWTNGTTNTFANMNVGPSGWANITVFAYNASGTGTLSAGSVSDSLQAPAAPEQNYIPPDPTNLANTTSNYWVNYTWSVGASNVTDSYNVSLNSAWTNGTTNTFANMNVGPSGWANITVFAYNASGTGTLSAGSVSDEVRAPHVADTTPPTVTGNEPTGTDVPVSTQIHVTFSEAMDQASAESAFSTSPVTFGSFGWNGNIMTYTPNSDLTPDTTYMVTIGTDAKDLADNNMEAEHTWDFTTEATSSNIIQNPGFESGTSPWRFYTSGTGTFSVASPGFEGNNAAKLDLYSDGANIQFYQMGVTLEPNTRYRFSFAGYSTTGHDVNVRLIKHVSPYTNYGLNFAADLGTNWDTFTTEFTTTGFTGTVDDGRLQFWLAPFAEAGDTYYIDNVRLEKVDIQDTTPPTVTGNEPTGTDVPVSTQIHVTFSEAMDQASAESAFSTSPVTFGSFGWNGNIMTYTPNSDLTPDTTYMVTI